MTLARGVSRVRSEHIMRIVFQFELVEMYLGGTWTKCSLSFAC